jgi:hypothetical protein
MLLAALATCTACSEQAAGTPHKGCQLARLRKLRRRTRRRHTPRSGRCAQPDRPLNQGPSPATLDALERVLAERYEQLVEQSRKNPHAPVTVTKERFVALYGGALDAQHRIRAAQALAEIGGERARAALEAAASQTERDDVRAAVTKLLSVMKDRN